MMTQPTLAVAPRLSGYAVELRGLARLLQSQIQQALPVGLDQAARTSRLVEQAELRMVAHELMQLLILIDDGARCARGGILTQPKLEALHIAGATLARKLDVRIGERKRKRQRLIEAGIIDLLSEESAMSDQQKQALDALSNKLRQLYELLSSMMKNLADTKHKPVQNIR